MKPILIFLICIVLASCAGSQKSEPDYITMGIADLENEIINYHPAAYYVLAIRLFEKDRKEDAVFWFYAGQLRYRYYLATLSPDKRINEIDLFSSLSSAVGNPINEYAFGNIPALAKRLDEVLNWDEQTPNLYCSKTSNPAEYVAVRKGLVDMRDTAVKEMDEIYRERTENGLPTE